MTNVEVLMPAPMLPSVMDALERSYTLHRLWECADPSEFLGNRGRNIRAVAASTLAGRIDAALLDRLPALEIVANFGVGYDNIDVAAAAERGVVVTNTPGVLDDEVADLAIALLLATLRRIPEADAFVRRGAWLQGSFPLSPTLRGRRIGIVGMGNIGKTIARRLEGFDVAIGYYSRSQKSGLSYAYHSSVRQLAHDSDVLIIVVPGGPDTRHLIAGEVLDALGAAGVLINISRGSVVDEAALIEALAGRKILAAGLDVYQHEPRVPDALIALPNTVLLPHIGSASEYTRTAMGELVVRNLAAWFDRRRPLTPVPETQHLVAGDRRHS